MARRAHRNRHRDRCQVFSIYGIRMRAVSMGEAFELVRLQRAAQVKIRKDGTPEVIQLLAAQEGFNRGYDPNDSDASAPSLMLGDVESNAFGAAGMAKRRAGKLVLWADYRGKLSAVEATGNRVDRAMSKVEAWPEVGDTRAVRVGPRICNL